MRPIAQAFRVAVGSWLLACQVPKPAIRALVDSEEFRAVVPDLPPSDRAGVPHGLGIALGIALLAVAGLLAHG